MNVILDTLWQYQRTRRLRWQTLRELSALSDHALKVIGLERHGLRAFVDKLVAKTQQPQTSTGAGIYGRQVRQVCKASGPKLMTTALKGGKT